MAEGDQELHSEQAGWNGKLLESLWPEVKP